MGFPRRYYRFSRNRKIDESQVNCITKNETEKKMELPWTDQLHVGRSSAFNKLNQGTNNLNQQIVGFHLLTNLRCKDVNCGESTSEHK